MVCTITYSGILHLTARRTQKKTPPGVRQHTERQEPNAERQEPNETQHNEKLCPDCIISLTGLQEKGGNYADTRPNAHP